MRFSPGVDEASARAEIERLVFDLPGFLACTIRRKVPDSEGHIKAALRPVALREASLQLTCTGGPSAKVTNFSRNKARPALRALLDQAAEIHVDTTHVELNVRIAKSSRILLTRRRPRDREDTGPAAHDRTKDYPLARIEAQPLLRAIGFSDSQDRILPSMQAKYRQVNEFLRVLDSALPAVASLEGSLRILDAGCGKAYLSFAAQVYLSQSRKCPVELTGVDIREDLVRSCQTTAERLSLSPPETEFVVGDIAAYQPRNSPDVVVSLHACDSASDDAIARGVEWGARVILCAPCCQHDVQKQLSDAGPQRALLRHGILRERLADLLADAFRAQLLRILGYRVRVIEFVEPEATGRNIMIRAERGVRPGISDTVAEYEALCSAWGVTPYLEKRLSTHLRAFLPVRGESHGWNRRHGDHA